MLARGQEGIPGDITSEPESEYGPPADTVESSLTSVTAAAYTSVKCSAKIDNAHYSNGAGGAIFKAVVTCSGTGATSVKVQVGSVLSFAPSSAANKVPTSTYKTRAESKYTQSVPVNSGSKTFYVPTTGNGGTGKGFWIRTSVWQITSPGLGTIGSQTKTNWCDLKKGSKCS